MDDPLQDKEVLREVFLNFSKGSGIHLRRYQQNVALAILESVVNGQGRTFVVMFPRQSGKNEVQAHIEAFLLQHYAERGGEIVKLSPTWRPQSIHAMRRLQRMLERNREVKSDWRKQYGYIYQCGQAAITFLSGGPQSNIVGASANLLLEVDEAQDVGIEKFDKEIAPMAASTDATRVFWGTAWTSTTLLGRELRTARRLEVEDGIPRAFVLTADDVMDEVPAYRRFVQDQVERLGREHPMVRTQYYSEEIDETEGMFPASRIALMHGSHPRRRTPPSRDGIYCLLVDVGGEERSPDEPSARRDATALTVVEVDLTPLGDPLLRAPRYRALDRRVWVGAAPSQLYAEITALAELWRAQQVVVDATGLGAGLASFLEKALPGRVTPYVFSSASKSKLGWNFLALVNAGRWQEWAVPENQRDSDQALFFQQLRYAKSEVSTGPGRELRWGVPEGTRDAETGRLVHDDLLLSAALAAALDGVHWGSRGPALVIPGRDPLAELDRGF